MSTSCGPDLVQLWVVHVYASRHCDIVILLSNKKDLNKIQPIIKLSLRRDWAPRCDWAPVPRSSDVTQVIVVHKLINISRQLETPPLLWYQRPVLIACVCERHPILYAFVVGDFQTDPHWPSSCPAWQSAESTQVCNCYAGRCEYMTSFSLTVCCKRPRFRI